MELRTPFFDKHVEAGANITPPGGWRLASNYKTISDEVNNVINGVAFIDFSSMAAIHVLGKDAAKMLQYLVVNDVCKLNEGKGLYTQMVDENGVMLDDITVFCLKKNNYIVVTSTAKASFDLKYFNEEAKKYEDINIVEGGYGILCLNGPRSRDTLLKLTSDVSSMKYFDIVETSLKKGDEAIPCIIARAGFTGELGFEVYVNAKYGVSTWDFIMEAGKEYNIQPFGLKAVESLRIEKYYLGGGDFYPKATPIQLGLGWTIKFDKGEFVGKKALLKQKKEGYATKLVGFEVLETNDVVPPASEIYKGGKAVGKVTSANYGYRIKKSVALGWINTTDSKISEVYVAKDSKTGREFKLKLVETPFFDKECKVLKA